MAHSTLLGVDDCPGELAGHGPVPAALARAIAADSTGTWRRLVTDHTGQLVEVGRRTYRPPAGLARHVQARDRTCRFPHCHQPARRTDIDHITDWHDRGTTEPENLHLLCRRHHRLKHQTTWRVRRHRDGDTEWTSPAGRRYIRGAARYPATAPPF